MPTYLAAFVICDYEHISRIERGKEVSEGDAPGAGAVVLAAGPSCTPRSQGLHLRGHGRLLLLPPSAVTAPSTMLRSGAQPFHWGSAEGRLQKGCASHPLEAGFEPLLPDPATFQSTEKRGRGRISMLKLRLPVVSLAYMLLVPRWASWCQADASWGSCSGWNAGRLSIVPMKEQACWVWTLPQSCGNRCSVLEHLVFTQLYLCYIIILWENIKVIVTVLYGLVHKVWGQECRVKMLRLPPGRVNFQPLACADKEAVNEPALITGGELLKVPPPKDEWIILH